MISTELSDVEWKSDLKVSSFFLSRLTDLLRLWEDNAILEMSMTCEFLKSSSLCSDDLRRTMGASVRNKDKAFWSEEKME